ncbi:MAG: 16S rRNA (cytidine(1402)-2'-O)-methyltransferase [Acidobacteriota bacterium]|nr:16S rRNA (cytidine(1402)-2'-O)-methyltransferase [Acidobacteriota bacterium]
MSGRLLLVSTPIGNLEDLTPRARRAFEEAQVIACEDTRVTGRLLQRLGIKRRLVSLHEHNERSRVPGLLEELRAGNTVAVTTDAGTPLVSDPGFVLVRAAAREGTRIEPIAGPSAILAALVASALPPHPFTFAGFPPPKTGKRRKFYRRFAPLEHTLIFFESPHRIVASLEDARTELGDRPAALCRELTKLHEETLRGTLSEVHQELAARSSIKGELTLVVQGAGNANATPEDTGAGG